MTYIIINFSVEGWMVPAQKKAELKKSVLDIDFAAVYLLVESPGIQISSH